MKFDRPAAGSCRGASLVEKETAHMAKKHTAQCPCGAVKFEFDTDAAFVGVCHGLDCKKTSGGEAATFFGMPEDDFAVDQRRAEGVFHHIAQSGQRLDRNFCPKLRCRGVHQQPGELPGNDLRHVANVTGGAIWTSRRGCAVSLERRASPVARTP